MEKAVTGGRTVGSLECQPKHAGCAAATHEIVLKVQRPFGGPHNGADLFITHWDHGLSDSQSPAQAKGDFREAHLGK
ncbi:hypothetical protein D9M69_583610 [compost metagenome]